ncbi:MAG TPA: hypothetical protein VMZ11_02825 [Mycobacteriales bacterium]|nr:hypothetical protein [Mycobacteriales bacterium]
MRRVLLAGLACSVLPGALALLAVQPAGAEALGFESVSTSAIVTGVALEGTIGASGGLLNIDGGSARVVAALDGSPSSRVASAPYEPGGGIRAVIGQVNTAAGQAVLGVPDAEASSPGARNHGSVEAVPGRSVGPIAVLGGAATADASPTRATGTATGVSLAVVGALTSGGSTSSVDLRVDAAAGRVTQLARSSVASIDVAGVLHLEDVEATARITATRDAHTAVQTLTVGGASVNGQAVTIGNDGVTVAGTPLLPGQTLADLTATVSGALTQAGITVRTVGGIARHDGRSAAADSGGVLITLATPGLPVGGIAGNSLKILVGQAALTETDTLATLLPQVQPPVSSGGVTVPPSTSTTFVPGTPGTPGLPGTSVTPPTVAANPVSYLVAGHRFTARTALIAFAAWQVLSLGMPTLYALVDRRRRLMGVVPA